MRVRKINHSLPAERLSSYLEPFISSCEKLLITAARDLAVLNQYHVRASTIVSLSLTCESLQKMKQKGIYKKADVQAIREMCRKLLLELEGICHIVWKKKELRVRRKHYEAFREKAKYWWESLGTIY